jgi:hypothetical protein
MDNTLIVFDEEHYIYYLVQKSGVRNNNKKVEVGADVCCVAAPWLEISWQGSYAELGLGPV